MKKYGIDAIRNIGLFGHQGSGKTSLAEAMLFTSGGIDRMGRPDDGTSTSDFDAEEIKRHISINVGLAPCEWQGRKINILDVPGYLDFQGEMRGALRVVDAAVIITPAQSAMEVGFDIAWELAEERNCPRVIFINKMDRENADFFNVVELLRSQYGTMIAPVQIPIGQADKFIGMVDILHLKAYVGVGKDTAETKIPDDLSDTVAEYREKLIESAAEGDDELLEKYLETGTLSDEEVIKGLHAGIDTGKVAPVICGSSAKNQGVYNLLSLITEAFPNPAEMGDSIGTSPDGKEISRKPSENEPFSALVFKTLADPFVGQLTYFRVFSGTLHSDSHVLNGNTGKEERIGQIYVIKGKSQEAVPEISAGDIGAVAKLSNTHTGDTLCDSTKPSILKSIDFPKPIYEIAIKAKTKVDEDKMGPALQRVAAEDPTFAYRRDPGTGQTVISGMGETHLNIVVEKLRKFGANVDVVQLKVPYRETVLTTAQGQGKHKKQTGGRGQYGDCWLKLEPNPRGAGFEFVDAIVGGAIPRQYIPAVEKGVQDAMSSGILSGNPVVDVKCTCYDGSFHEVDSSEAAFKMAGILGFNSVAAKANPVILEPMCVVSVVVPEDMMGDVMSDLSGKRGRIIGTESIGRKRTCVKALVPQSEMLRYAIDLRSITRGRGSFEITPSHYEEVPAHIAQQIIAEYQKSREQS